MRLFFIGSDAGKIGAVLFCIQLGAHAAQAAVQVMPDQRFNGVHILFPDHAQDLPVLAEHIRHIVGPHHIQTGEAGVVRLRLGQALPDVPLVSGSVMVWAISSSRSYLCLISMYSLGEQT